jgi:hypothetical protein
VTTDQGGDQAAAVRRFGEMLRPDENCIFIAQWCMQHAVHLCVQRQLRRGGRYLARLAEIAHTWRGSSARMREACLLLQGRAVAPPPPPLRGRWGACHATEAALLAVGREPLLAAFRHVFGEPAGPAEAVPDEGDGTLLGETTAQYSARMGRWRQGALASLADVLFWGEVLIAHVCRGPVMHVMHWLQQSAASRDRGVDGGPALELLTSRLPMLQSECSQLLQGVAQWSGLQGLGLREAWWRQRALMCVLEMAADFDRRFFAPSGEFPLAMLWLGAAEPEARCAARRHVAARLLRASEPPADPAAALTIEPLDGASVKVGRLFRRELAQAAASGTCCRELHRFIRDLPGT